MLSKKKIKIMFRMASYESGVGRKDLKIVKYYKTDYIRLNILKSVVCMTFEYVLILGLIVLYNFEELVKSAVTLPYYSIGIKMLGIYLLLLAFYVLVSIAVYSRQYDKARKRVQRYFRYLKYITKYYQNDGSRYEEEEGNDA